MNMEDTTTTSNSNSNSNSNSKEPTGFLRGNTTAVGLWLDQIGVSPMVMSFLSLSVAILTLAEESVGCENLNDDEDCDEKVWGVKPSSIVTLTNGVTGILSAFLMPISGAVTDYTPYRKEFGYWTAFIMIALNAIQISIGPSTWELCLISAMIAPPLFFLHTVITNAYIANLSEETDELAYFVSWFDVTRYTSNIAFVVLLLGLSKAFNAGDVDTAIIGQVCTVFFSVPAMFLAWKKIESVPALREKPEHLNYFTAGFKNIICTSKEIALKNPPFKWFLRTIMFASPCFTAFAFVNPTFCKEWLNFDADELILTTLVATLFAAPGAMLGKLCCNKWNPLAALRLFIVLGFLTSFLSAALLEGPDDGNKAYIWVAACGLTIGGYFVAETTLMASLVPKDQQAELMGLYVFFSRVLVWICPVILLVLNERDFDLNKAMIAVQAPCIIALLLSIGMGSYENVVQYSSEHKQFRNSNKQLPIVTDVE